MFVSSRTNYGWLKGLHCFRFGYLLKRRLCPDKIIKTGIASFAWSRGERDSPNLQGTPVQLLACRHILEREVVPSVVSNGQEGRLLAGAE